MGSAALLQHYGFPTEIVDTTSSIEVAASFAISHNVPGKPGRILVYPMDKLIQNAIVIDLSLIDWARRPKRQCGFMIFHRNYQDWRHEHLIQDLHVEEHPFVASAGDRQRFDKSAILVGPSEQDPVSGLLNKLAYDCVLPDLSPLPKQVDKWLKERIPPADFPTRVISRDSKGQPTEVEPDLCKFADFVEGRRQE